VSFSAISGSNFTEYFGYDSQTSFDVPIDLTAYGMWDATNPYNGPYKDATFKKWVETTYGLSNPAYKKATGSVNSYTP